MSKFHLTVFFVCVVMQLYAQKPESGNSILYWSQNRELTFADFKGKPSRHDTTLQQVSTSMSVHKLSAIITAIDVQLLTRDDKTTFTIRAAMKQNLSWLKDTGDNILLKHEQGHFDICEIYARLLRRDIKTAKTLSQAKEIYERVSLKEEEEQNRFDVENMYANGGITKEWKDYIATKIKELELYRNPVVTMPFNK